MSRRQVRHVTLDAPKPRFDAAKVRRLRDEYKLTNEKLALEVGVTLRTIQRWQLGEGSPAGFQLISLAEALGVEPADLYLTEEAA